jgi:hypothetical protein
LNRLIPILILALVVLPSARADMVVNGPPSATDRFAAGSLNPGFWPSLSGYNLTGVGNTNADGTGQWATAISPSFALTSEHFPVPAGGSVYFTAADGSRYAAVVKAEENVGGTDLRLVQFTAPLPASIARFSFAPDDPAALTGAPILSFGVPYRAAQGSIASFGTSQEGVLAQTYRFDYSPTGPALQGWVQPGDSGGPTFAEEPGGGLALAGLHSFYSGTGGPPYYSIDTFASPLLDAMRNDIAGLGSSDLLTIYTASIPEPSASRLVFIGLCLGWAWRLFAVQNENESSADDADDADKFKT